ncbi:hypothetical protein [Komagataeibacter sp. FNDCF1]|uniref:hypothetical protein n=1 Tax=Komagataeibacter sp. FNDCF1 TaxID=2878681 RepID=UPI001E2B2675|nr:hypothetical protein [Komagataeibacter sp. FNDCF1]MCE2564181.1 hypothetical protein [Komagataeibacter sp. FNDCF1]
MPRKPERIMPTDEKDARINRGITAGPDSPEPTATDFRNARPVTIGWDKVRGRADHD